MSGQFKAFVKKFTPRFLLDFYYWLWALISAIVFWFPSRKLIVIGVTGTSGKSTTVDFITRILEEADQKVASLSSIRFKVRDKEWKNELKMTMPGRFVMQRFLRQAVNAKCKYAVLEVTSEGIQQFRHKFITFDTAVFTNLTPEHIESHGGFENYRNEKLKLFKATKNTHIINTDDQNAKYFLETPAKKIMTFGSNGGDLKADLTAQAGNINGTSFTARGTQFNLKLMGNFNVYNALTAISVGLSEGISLEVCKRALEKTAGAPGRMEVIAREPFLVVVDYAHTPEQLEQAYKSLSGKNLVCVLGACGGGRDKWKRPVLGRLAGQYCKEIIITNEDPYDEDPLEIMEQVASGIVPMAESRQSRGLTNESEPSRILDKVGKNHDHHIVLDRKEAIKKAIELVKPQGAVIITGKGAEPLMCLKNGKKIPWDDRQIVKELLKYFELRNS